MRRLGDAKISRIIADAVMRGEQHLPMIDYRPGAIPRGGSSVGIGGILHQMRRGAIIGELSACFEESSIKRPRGISRPKKKHIGTASIISLRSRGISLAQASPTPQRHNH